MKNLLTATFLTAAIPAFAQAGPDTWSDPSGPPLGVGTYGGIVATGADTLFVTLGVGYGTGTKALYRRTLSTGAWTRMADSPALQATGAGLVHPPGSNHLYLMAGYPSGGGSSAFYRYSIADGNGESADTWSTMTPFPDGPLMDMSMAATADKVYVLGGPDYATFGRKLHEFTPQAAGPGTWVLKTTGPALSMFRLTCPDPAGDFLYSIDQQSLTLFRYSIASGSWESSATSPSLSPIPASYTPSNLSFLAPGPGGSFFGVIGNYIDKVYRLYRYDPAANRWTVLAANPDTLPASPGGGAGLAWFPGQDAVWYLRGTLTSVSMATNHLWRYSLSQDRFLTTLPLTPVSIGMSGALAALDNGEDLYVQAGYFGGTYTRDFFHYSISTKTWTRKAYLPFNGFVSSFMTSGGSHLYANLGNTTTLYRYSIAGDFWEALPSAPSGWAGVFVGSDSLFRVQSTGLVRYTPSTAQSQILAPPPSPLTIGASLAYPGSGNLIYVLSFGGGAVPTRFWIYNIVDNVWNVDDRLATFDPADPPLPAYTGSSLCWHPPTRQILALTSSSTTSFVRRFLAYSLDGDTWAEVSDTPGMVGGSFTPVYPGSGPFVYAISGNDSRAFWRYQPFPLGPPAQLDQLHGHTLAPIPVGGSTVPLEVVLQARGTGSGPLRLEVEVKPVDASFTGAPGQTEAGDPAVGGMTLSTRVPGLLPGTLYHWRGRLVDANGPASSWSSFGRNADAAPAADTDFRIRTNAAPGVSGLAQRIPSPGGTLPSGMHLFNQPALRFEGIVSDSDPGDLALLEVEVRPFGTAFRGEATASGPLLPDGSTAGMTLALEAGSYRWQARAVDQWGRGGPWTPYDSAGGSAPDFVLLDNGSLGGSTCLHSVGVGSGAILAALALLLSVRRRAT